MGKKSEDALVKLLAVLVVGALSLLIQSVVLYSCWYLLVASELIVATPSFMGSMAIVLTLSVIGNLLFSGDKK